MNAIELLDIISSGETSKVQFKQEMDDDKFAAEMIAMSNSKGGVILVGVKDKTGEVMGLTYEQLQSYNNRLANIANDKIKPQIFISTEVVKITSETGENKILVVYVDEGVNKPYKDNSGTIWVKQGSDKRKLIDNSEIMRLFQQSSNLFADEMEVYDTTIDDIDERLFADYFKKEFKVSYQEKGLTYEEALRAKRVLRNDKVSLAGLLFFGKDPQNIKPAFTIKIVSFFGNDIAGNSYRNKPEDLKGTIPELFKQSMNFLRSNLHHTQQRQEFNSVGILEISEIVLTELLQNALIHRDYFKNAPIKIIIFDNRVEIVSPGKLPNSLTIDDIKYGNTVIRNNQIAMFSSHTMPYSGLGSGIKRAVAQQPDIELINDIAGEQFIVKIPRAQQA
ncbi:MAG: putative DNA binding domain-containing protein [Massilibacteroides sp.]|nr:putative DNA binding domain-containing protein [Massilibacteroides sp.]MDD3062039.1 putative DNA binding domain-containing protein [Massilibacteroides sp.]MDD4659244.1 putative DNA binding domain-containing protein [Massilibacteroides sp.]